MIFRPETYDRWFQPFTRKPPRRFDRIWIRSLGFLVTGFVVFWTVSLISYLASN